MPNPATLRAQPALHWSSEALASMLCRCFDGYLVPFQLDGAAFAYRFGAENVCLNASRIWLAGETVVALALVARRGWRSRLAAFAIHPDWRGKGVGKTLMTQLLDEAHERGEKSMTLEVIVGNDAGQALYERVGFTCEKTLVGFQAHSPAAFVNTQALMPCDPHDIAQRMAAQVEDLPWLMAPETAQALPGMGFSLDDKAFAIIATGFAQPQLRALWVAPQARREGRARQLLSLLHERFAGLMTPVAVDQRLAPLFEQSGFRIQPVRQYEMRHRLN
ncbi:GNAT family N-acetyltransferase [Cronobacter malonaticus]|nr:GNAT family N-acetyltransferase [Cronobacter malonaticus]